MSDYIRRWTTPTCTLTVRDPEGNEADLSEINLGEVYVSFGQRGERIRKPYSELTISGGKITFQLTQRETGRLRAGDVYVQVNIIDADGRRVATGVTQGEVRDNLLDKEVDD